MLIGHSKPQASKPGLTPRALSNVRLKKFCHSRRLNYEVRVSSTLLSRETSGDAYRKGNPPVPLRSCWRQRPSGQNKRSLTAMAGTGSIHYKFKSARSFETVFFEGHEISPSELKALICEKQVWPQFLMLAVLTASPRNQIGRSLKSDTRVHRFLFHSSHYPMS